MTKKRPWLRVIACVPVTWLLSTHFDVVLAQTVSSDQRTTGGEGKMPDSLPVLDLSPRVPGLIHAFGFSGRPGTGAVLAELATQGHSSTDISGFRIARFGKGEQAVRAG